MLVMLSAAIAPGLALLSYFYLKDQYETEPISVVVKTFLFGVFLVLPIMFIQYVLETEHILNTDLANAFLWAALLEEFFKWFILIYVIYQHVAFDEPYDGIVYGAAVSLGFATMENILYLLANGVEHAFLRAVLPVSSHALFGVIMGYYLGKAKFSASNNRVFLLLALIIPISLHGVYDYILVSQKFWVYFIMPFMIYLWWLGMKKVKKARLLSDFHANKLSQNHYLSK
ncbi:MULTISPECIES: glutamic-type intramembrane protease PrsW [Peribacillus]|uniref:Protease PrsW n=1 Tax=Peribacillus simplex TaxID=1478 RepID=A0A9W4L2Q3_9BACI|nr:glutamic-type intramembrane protease PrsW [Peribacillus simplex]MDR4925751.1 glutamic-type intramembrane protease PrsW [Peribacillus simplex]WHX89609.1 glutamic-type intramembrane protease PrsW [Peribacillus simplex]CAH0229105.1 Protease PrsW [Peribacillus simplex]